MPPGTPYKAFIPPYPIRVDEFTSSPSLTPPPALHLLSHTHSDHISGLSAKSFSSKIICLFDTKKMLLKHEAYKERAFISSSVREDPRLGRTFEHLKVDPVKVGGRIRYEGSRDLLVTIPFYYHA